MSCVLGEFYWKVDPGEQVWMTDYLRPPEMLSREITHGGPDSGEISWSRAAYLPVATIEQAFGLKHALRRPSCARAEPAVFLPAAVRLVGRHGRADGPAGNFLPVPPSLPAGFP